MATTNDLLVTGNSRITGALNLGVSGEIKEGDYRAVDGDTVARSTLYPPYKEVLYGPNNYGGVTLPIPVDAVVKSTRTIVVRVIPYSSYMYVPRYYQFYDESNWLRSNGNINAANPLNIYVIQLDNTRNGVLDSSTNTLTIGEVSPNMYCGDYSANYNFNVAVETNTTTLNSGTIVWTCNFSNTSLSIIMAAFKISDGSSNVMTIKTYDTLASIRADGLLKYL